MYKLGKYVTVDGVSGHIRAKQWRSITCLVLTIETASGELVEVTVEL